MVYSTVGTLLIGLKIQESHDYLACTFLFYLAGSEGQIGENRLPSPDHETAGPLLRPRKHRKVVRQDRNAPTRLPGASTNHRDSILNFGWR